MNNLVKEVKNLLQIAKNTLKGKKLIEKTGKINVKGDVTIGMDVRIEELFLNYIKKQNLPATIFSEEIGAVRFHEKPKLTIAFDPLDGSTNYRVGNELLPYGVLIAVYKGVKPRLKDIICAGALENTKGFMWIYDGKQTKNLINNKVIRIKNDWEIHKSTPVYFDLYYKKAFDTFSTLPEKVHVRWNGSTISSLMYVLSNTAAGMGSVCMRAEEIGAVYGLIRGAGGIVVNADGTDLGEEEFDPKRTYFILGGCEKIVRFCLKEINKL